MSASTPSRSRPLGGLARGFALLAAAGVLGCGIGLTAVGFLAGSEWLFAWAAGNAAAPWWALLLLPAAAGGLSWLACRRLPNGLPLGPAEVVRATSSGLRHVRMGDGLRSAGASFGCLALGGSVGAYGPLVHLGSMLGAQAARAFGIGYHRIGLGCGCAAAIAAAFHAPLAGIVFAHEVVLGHYSLRVFAPVAMAALLAHWMVLLALGRGQFLSAIAMGPVDIAQIAVFGATGLACGVLAWLLIVACLRTAHFAAALPVPAWSKPVAGGLCAGLIAAVGLPEVLGSGRPLIEQLAAGSMGGGQAGLLLAGKMAATVACIGMGMAGGLFSPALTIGALFGTLCGLAASALFGAAAPPVAVCALVGMFATAAPVIGAPLAGVLIAVEFSGSYQLGTAVAVGIVIATVVSGRLVGGSYYQRQAARAGTPPDAGPEQRVLSAIAVRDRMRPVPPSGSSGGQIAATASLWDAVTMAEPGSSASLVVVDESGKAIGELDITECLLELASHVQRNRAEEREL